jgi:hypothetical protein
MAHREYNSTGVKNFDAAEAIPRHRLVKLGTAGTITLADANEEAIGASVKEAFASGENIGVKMTSAAGTVALEAAGAFNAGAVVYGQANGKVDDVSSSTLRYGIALEAAGADGDIVEVLPDKGA